MWVERASEVLPAHLSAHRLAHPIGHHQNQALKLKQLQVQARRKLQLKIRDVHHTDRAAVRWKCASMFCNSKEIRHVSKVHTGDP